MRMTNRKKPSIKPWFGCETTATHTACGVGGAQTHWETGSIYGS